MLCYIGCLKIQIQLNIAFLDTVKTMFFCFSTGPLLLSYTTKTAKKTTNIRQ